MICADQPAQVHCENCVDNYCEVCFAAQHRKGSRKQHKQKPLVLRQIAQKKAKASRDGKKDDGEGVRAICDLYIRVVYTLQMDQDEDSAWEDVEEELAPAPSVPQTSGQQPKPGADVGEWFVDRAKFIPLRLTLSERKFLRLLEAALQVSEYTDKIDTVVYGSKMKRIVHQIRELCAILSGLVLAADYKQVRVFFVIYFYFCFTSFK